MRNPLLLWLLLFTSNLIGQNLAGYEYFFNTYEKAGDGIFQSFNSENSDTVIIDEIDINNLQGGPQILYIRVKDDLGRWSHTSKRVFIIPDKNTSDVIGIEYFFDKYLAPGKGVYVPIDNENLYEIDVTQLEVGPHILFNRAKNSLGEWSHTSKRVFVVSDYMVIPDIVRFEYWYEGLLFTSEDFEFSDFTPGRFFEFSESDFLGHIYGLQPGKSYTLHIKAICENGVESEVALYTFLLEEFVGTFEIAKDNESIILYPVPAVNELNISSDELELIGLKYFIYDMNGRVCEKGLIYSNSIDIQLKEGNYTLVICSDETIFRKKFTVL